MESLSAAMGKAFKNDEKYFLFHVKSSFLFSRYMNFCPDFFGHIGKRIDKKAKANFKIYYVTGWETNNYNTLFAKYLKK